MGWLNLSLMYIDVVGAFCWWMLATADDKNDFE
jgi:hypothetical protein